MTPPQSLTALLDQTGWIHGLARRLVADVHAAEDLVQDTWVDALEECPDQSRPVRGWLATVMRHRLSKWRRGERHRAARQEDASRPEAQPSTLDVVERAATHRDLVLAVMELEEPYRSTLLMRFFEQLPYGEIARRTGATRATVNSRITRGLQRLRERLEADYGGDLRALCVALAPLAKLPTGVAATLLGAKPMYVLIGTAAVALVAVTANVGLFPEAREPGEPVLAAGTGQSELEEGGVVELAAIEPAAAPATREPQLVGLRQERRPVQTEKERDVWQTELSHVMAVPEGIESMAVNTGSGDIDVEASFSGNLEITAKVRARLSKVDAAGLTQVFEDHVKIMEKGKNLVIEDDHENENGWSVSFVLRVPAGLKLNANTGSGDVRVSSGSTAVNANTGSGDVLIAIENERVQSLNANTGSGDVEVRIAGVEKSFNANTGSGDVRAVILDAVSPGKASFNTGSGDVTLVVPPGVVGTFQMETHGGEIEVPAALGLVVTKKPGGGKRAEGGIPGGGLFRMNSGSGDVELLIGTALPAQDR